MRCLESRLHLAALVFVTGCGSVTGELDVSVDEEGTVAISLVDKEMMPVVSDSIYLLVRSENAKLAYAGIAAGSSLCEQLPREGPLVLRLSSQGNCPEVHVAAFVFSAPKAEEGQPEIIVPLEQRCTENRTLIATASWFDPNCEIDGGVIEDVGTSSTADAGMMDTMTFDAGNPDAGSGDADESDMQMSDTGTTSMDDAGMDDAGMDDAGMDDAGTSSTSDGGQDAGADDT